MSTKPSRGHFGLSAAVATPFREDGTIDIERMAAHCRRLLAEGCTSLTLFGSTGEGASLGLAERRWALLALADRGVRGEDMIVGVAASARDDTVQQIAAARQVGCRTVLVAPPFFFTGIHEDGLADWYDAILGASECREMRFLIYNIPQLTGIMVPPRLVAELARRHPGRIVGVKDSSGQWPVIKAFLNDLPDLAVVVGDERLLARALDHGAAGTISGFANIRPDRILAILNGDGIPKGLDRTIDEIVAHPVTPAVKAVLAHDSDQPAWRRVRAPLTVLTDRERHALVSVFDRLIGQAPG